MKKRKQQDFLQRCGYVNEVGRNLFGLLIKDVEIFLDLSLCNTQKGLTN